MGLQSAMTTALTGLQAAETTIDVVGNNVANSNTVGFKESEVLFATQFLQTLSIGSAPQGTQGGTNPRQIGLGVRVAEIAPNWTQGTIEISSNPLDLAIQGDGFFVVQGNQSGTFYTRNGQFNLNSSNEIVTSTGQKLLGYGVNDDFELVTTQRVPITIPLGAERVAQQTNTATFAGVLNPGADIGSRPQIVESAVLGNGAIERPDDTNFDDASITVSPPPAPPAATAAAGGTLAEGDYSYRVVWRDANGLESAPTVEVSVNTIGLGARDIDLSAIPEPPSGVWTSWELYRTTSGGDTFYRVPAPGVGTTFTDSLDDVALANNAVLDESTVDPGTYSYYVTYFNTSDGTETRPSSRITANSIPDEGRRIHLNLADVGEPVGEGFNTMRIYRNASDSSSEFRLLAEVPAPGISGFVGTYVDSSTDADIAGAPTLNFDGPPAGNGNLLQDLLLRNGESYSSLFPSDGLLTFAGEKNGVDLATQSLNVDATTNVGQLIDFMREALGIDTDGNPAFPLNGNVEIVNGQFRITSNLGEENAIEIPLTAFRFQPAGETLSAPLSIPFTRTQAADGPGTSTEFLVYDSLGSPLSVRVTTVRETSADPGNSTTYRWYATSSGNEPDGGVSTVVGDGLLVFDSQGDLDLGSTATARISIERNQTASLSPLEIELDFSSVKSLDQRDEQNDPFSNLNMTVQDGFPPGVLTDFTITDSGLIQGQFSNGTQRTLGQVVMARFANNGGLQQVGDSLFVSGVNSGEPSFGTPGQEGIGSVTTGAVELSNTDIGQNLIELILASTQYRGGSRVISAAQELLDELLALRR